MVVREIEDNILNRITDFILPRSVVDLLNTTIFTNSWIWLNYWSFVHLFAGVGFYFLFPGGLWAWVIINVVFEIIEFILSFGGHPLFVEEAIDIVWDLIWSIGGFLLTRWIIGFFKQGKL